MRKRSYLSEADCIEALKTFAKKIVRMEETCNPGNFEYSSSNSCPAFSDENINIILMLKGDFGVAKDFFEVIRIFARYRLPKKEKQNVRSK